MLSKQFVLNNIEVLCNPLALMADKERYLLRCRVVIKALEAMHEPCGSPWERPHDDVYLNVISVVNTLVFCLDRNGSYYVTTCWVKLRRMLHCLEALFANDCTYDNELVIAEECEKIFSDEAIY